MSLIYLYPFYPFLHINFSFRLLLTMVASSSQASKQASARPVKVHLLIAAVKFVPLLLNWLIVGTKLLRSDSKQWQILAISMQTTPLYSNITIRTDPSPRYARYSGHPLGQFTMEQSPSILHIRAAVSRFHLVHFQSCYLPVLIVKKHRSYIPWAVLLVILASLQVLNLVVLWSLHIFNILVILLAGKALDWQWTLSLVHTYE